ncbi:MAG: aldo/keto reductase [Armatimonadetes bacterium]|nr:aldo/keto reductase [Armatimonadota bacterium]
MEYAQLGNGGPEVSRICFGSWAMGATGWGEVDDAQTAAAAQRAFDLGINFFDTADVYGNGHSEEVLGSALAGVRDKVIIATKGGRRVRADGSFWSDGSPAWLHEAIDLSLRRLRTDYVDLYQLHWPDPEIPIEDSVGALHEIRQSGKARFVGVSNFGIDDLRRVLGMGPLISNQIPVNLFYREHVPSTLDFCAQQGIGVMAYGPMAQGLLTGKFSADYRPDASDVRSRSPLFAEGAFERNLEFVEHLKALASRIGRTPAQTAINWVLQQAGVTCAICGAKRPDQIEESASAAGWRLGDADLALIASVLPPSYASPRPLK